MDVKRNVCVFPVGTVGGELFVQTVSDKDGRLSCVAGKVEGERTGYEDFIAVGKSLCGLSEDAFFPVSIVDREKSGIVEKDSAVRTELVVIDVGERTEEGLQCIRSRKKESEWMKLGEMLDKVVEYKQPDGWMQVVLEGSGEVSKEIRVTRHIVMKGIFSGRLKVKEQWESK